MSLKSLIFHYPVFNTGGAERSTNKLMTAFCNRGWEVTLLLTTGGGDFEHALDDRVKVIYLRSEKFGSKFVEAKGIKKVFQVYDLLGYGLQVLREKWVLFMLRDREYQAGIVSLTGRSPHVLIKYINCRTRLHIIRNDVSGFGQIDLKKVKAAIEPYYQNINQYICVAGQTKKSLLAAFPFLEQKTTVIYNLLEPQRMIDALEGVTDPYSSYKSDTIKVITVCRLNDKAKGLLRMIKVHRKLLDQGVNHLWFVVGEGKDRKLIEESILENDVKESFILLGHRDNPYPYYHYADVSAILSYYEGFCGTVNEAKVMGKPVIATRFSGIREQIVEGKNGVVVANSEDAIVQGFAKLLRDRDMLDEITNDFLPVTVIDDGKKIETLEKLIWKKVY